MEMAGNTRNGNASARRCFVSDVAFTLLLFMSTIIPLGCMMVDRLERIAKALEKDKKQ